MNNPQQHLEGQRVLITGGTSGIGLALARRMSALGARVMICGRDRGRLDEVAGRIDVETAQCDVADSRALARLVQKIEVKLGGLDILVHNAAIQRAVQFGPTLEMTGHGPLDRELDVNLRGPIVLTNLALPLLAEQHRQHRARIVFLTSILATAPKASAPVYCASKAGLQSFARALRTQLRPHRIDVVEVVPPIVDTEMTAGRDENKISPETVADAIVESLVSGRPAVRVGKARFALLLHRVAPGLFAQMMAAK